MLRAESAIFRRGCGSFGALQQHHLGAFVCRIEEPSQRLVMFRIELPQIECPFLAWENPADEHDLDHIDEPELIVHQLMDTGSESRQLLRTAPPQALLFPGGELRGDARSKLGGPPPMWARAAR